MARAERPTPKRKSRTKPLSVATLNQMIEDAMVDAHAESEQITGFYTMLDDNLAVPFQARQVFDIIFDLLEHIDECLDDVIFIADERDSCELGIDWKTVLPPWFRVLSKTAEPEEYARRISSLLWHHYKFGTQEMPAIARKTATPTQRKALRDVRPGGEAAAERARP